MVNHFKFTAVFFFCCICYCSVYFSLFIQDWERSGVLVLKCSDDGEHGEEENACSS